VAFWQEFYTFGFRKNLGGDLVKWLHGKNFTSDELHYFTH
jgi:hypothetical protein